MKIFFPFFSVWVKFQSLFQTWTPFVEKLYSLLNGFCNFCVTIHKKRVKIFVEKYFFGFKKILKFLSNLQVGQNKLMHSQTTDNHRGVSLSTFSIIISTRCHHNFALSSELFGSAKFQHNRITGIGSKSAFKI